MSKKDALILLLIIIILYLLYTINEIIKIAPSLMR